MNIRDVFNQRGHMRSPGGAGRPSAAVASGPCPYCAHNIEVAKELKAQRDVARVSLSAETARATSETQRATTLASSIATTDDDYRQALSQAEARHRVALRALEAERRELTESLATALLAAVPVPAPIPAPVVVTRVEHAPPPEPVVIERVVERVVTQTVTEPVPLWRAAVIAVAVAGAAVWQEHTLGLVAVLLAPCNGVFVDALIRHFTRVETP